MLAERARGKAKIVALVVDADNELLARIASEVGARIISRPMAGKTPDRVAAIARDRPACR